MRVKALKKHVLCCQYNLYIKERHTCCINLSQTLSLSLSLCANLQMGLLLHVISLNKFSKRKVCVCAMYFNDILDLKYNLNYLYSTGVK